MSEFDTLTEEIRLFRLAIEEERDKPVTLIPQLTVLTHALEKYEPITLKFAGAGSWQNYYALIVVGGPDNGKRVDTYPWVAKEHLEYGAKQFNGSREEYDSYMGYPARPTLRYVGELHAVTVTAVSTWLIQYRGRSMADHLEGLYEKRILKNEELKQKQRDQMDGFIP